MRRLEGKIAVLAGGAGGIGSASSRRLASEGAAVMVGDLDGAQAADVAAEINRSGGKAISFALDMADPASIGRMFDKTVEAFGGVDLLHCNAARTKNITIEDLDAVAIDLAIWDATLAINLTGYLHCTRRAIPLMLKRGGGAIVYTSSGASYSSEDTRVAYACSKAGVDALMRHVARRWGKDGIRSNVVSPGLVMSPTAQAQVPPERQKAFLTNGLSPRLGEPDDIAAMVAMLCSNDGYWINGQIMCVNGGGSLR